MKTTITKSCDKLLKLGSNALTVGYLSFLILAQHDALAQGTSYGTGQIPFEDMTQYGHPKSAVRYNIQPDGTQIKHVGGYTFEYLDEPASRMQSYYYLDTITGASTAHGYDFGYEAYGRISNSNKWWLISVGRSGISVYYNWQYDNFGVVTANALKGGNLPRTEEQRFMDGNVAKRYWSIGISNFNTRNEDYKYKNSILDSIITYDLISSNNQGTLYDTTLVSVVSNIEFVDPYGNNNPATYIIGSHTLWKDNKTYRIVKKYDATGRPLLSTTLDQNGDSTQTIHWQYTNNLTVQSSKTEKITKEYDVTGKLVKVTTYKLQNSEWVLELKEQREFLNDTIQSVTYSNNDGPYRKFVFLPYTIDLFDNDKVLGAEDVHNNEGIVAVVSDQSQINVSDPAQLESLMLTSSNGQTLSLGVSSAISVAHVSGVQTLRVFYKDGRVENIKFLLP